MRCPLLDISPATRTVLDNHLLVVDRDSNNTDSELAGHKRFLSLAEEMTPFSLLLILVATT